MEKNCNWEPLSENLASEGVFSCPIVREKGFSISQLKLLPGAEIYNHPHLDDCEWYLNEDTGETFYCPKGASHSFRNDTDNIIHLISLKSK